MEPFRIKTMNRIAPEGLALFDDAFTIAEDAGDPQGIVVRSAPVDTDDYPSLLAVARAGSGVNNISVEAATARGICVFNAPGANANAVAELVFTMIGLGARNLHRGIDFCKSLAGLPEPEVKRRVEGQKSAFRGFELAGKTLGVLGLGKIGVRVANMGVHQHMKVIGFDPLPALENIHMLSAEVELARSIQPLLARAQILSLHMPFNEKTRNFVGTRLLSQLPHGLILVNFSRAEIVDDRAVLEALDTGRLDLYVTDFPTGALLGHPRVVASPHLGASTEESEEHCAVMAVGQLRAYLENGVVTNSVNFPTIEHIPSDHTHTRLIMINRDVPGMIGFASQTIGDHGINIASYLNESNGRIGYNIIDLEAAPEGVVIEKIQAHPDVIRTRTLRLAGG